MHCPVAENLASIRHRIEMTCQKCGRSPEDIELVAVSKRQPAKSIRAALEAGQRCFGENQVQEAVAKAADLPPDLCWHMIGPLQSNKIKAAVRLFDAFHSVDREKVARLLHKEASKLNRRVDVFFQVNIGAEPSKHGFQEPEIESIKPLLGLTHLRPVGLMAIPPLTEEPERAREHFAAMRRLRDRVVTEYPDVSGLSMGMTNDFDIAITEGATVIRVGRAIFQD